MHSIEMMGWLRSSRSIHRRPLCRGTCTSGTSTRIAMSRVGLPAGGADALVSDLPHGYCASGPCRSRA